MCVEFHDAELQCEADECRGKIITLLLRVGKLLSEQNDIVAALDSLLSYMRRHMGMQRAAINLLHRESGHVFAYRCMGMTPSEQDRGVYHVGEGITGKVVENATPIVLRRIGSQAVVKPTDEPKDEPRRSIAFGGFRVDLDARTGFFQGLAHGGLRRRFGVLHESGRQRPESVARLDGAATKEDSPIPFDDAADDDFRVLVVDRFAARADVARQRVARGRSEFDGRAAFGTVVHKKSPIWMLPILYDWTRPCAARGFACFPSRIIPLQCPEFMANHYRGAVVTGEVECF